MADTFNAITNLSVQLESFAVSYKNKGVKDQFQQGIVAVRRMGRALGTIYNLEELYNSSYTANKDRKANVYRNPINGNTLNGGEVADLLTDNTGNGTGQGLVNGGEGIRDVSKRLLGDAGKWKALVILNGLKAPYVSAAGDGDTVLRPGDPILFPIPVANAGSSNVFLDNENAKEDLENRLGRDIKLKRTSSDDLYGSFDLDVNTRGDLAADRDWETH